jgi:D-arabinose 1-dehydrogenase-like Zn-dependent alcohol dehydrogenase
MGYARMPGSTQCRRSSHEGKGVTETQDMLDFCGAHGITSDIELIPIQQIDAAYERMLKGDVKYRFVIDMASLHTAHRTTT